MKINVSILLIIFLISLNGESNQKKGNLNISDTENVSGDGG